MKAPLGFVVPIPTEPNEAVAAWKSTSQSGIAEENPTLSVILICLNVDMAEVVSMLVPSITLPSANVPVIVPPTYKLPPTNAFPVTVDVPTT